MTGSGTTPFQGEDNLSFDGTRLFVQGKLRVFQQSLSISGGSLSWGIRSGANATVTLNQNVTSFTISEFEAGDSAVLVVKQDGTGGKTMVLPANSQVVGGGTYTPTSAANSIDVLGVYFDGTYYYWTIGLASVTGNLITITNNADNRILTATGSSTSVNGETGLTYDGSTLSVTGAVTASGDITAYSDSRLKENVEVIENPIEKISKIRGVTFTRNDIENKEKRFSGVIAQEVLEVLPEVVAQGENGYYSVAYGNMIGLLIEAIKEQQKEINELKKLYK